jgi:hypothetical protein
MNVLGAVGRTRTSPDVPGADVDIRNPPGGVPMLGREGDDRNASLAHCRHMNNESPQREGQEPQCTIGR